MNNKAKQKKSHERGFNRISVRLHQFLTRLLSNFRMSLTFRIAIHYCGQMLRTTFSTILIVSIVFVLLLFPGWYDDMLRLRSAEVPPDMIFDQNVVQNSQAYAWLEEPAGNNQESTFDDNYFYLSLDAPPLSLVIVTPHDSGYVLNTCFYLERPVCTWACLTLTLLLCDLLRMIYFLQKHKRLDKRVLTPIRDITDMAATLSASNLSNRINIGGMKNELKELATVINTMLDRIERSYNSQKQFVSDASHELRTPIAVIQGYVSMLQRWGKEDRTVLDEGINAIAQETASMKDLVESLLFLARHDKKTLMLEVSSFDALDVLVELHREAAMVTPEDVFQLSPADHCVIEADRGMLKQVMRILCDNAVKYTPKGGTITLGIQRYATSCTLTVADNGPGIAADELPNIFERFYRSDSARKVESSGHGLGLSIARIIVIAHGGKLHVRSKVGVGTIFSIDLPLKQNKLHSANLERHT